MQRSLGSQFRRSLQEAWLMPIKFIAHSPSINSIPFANPARKSWLLAGRHRLLRWRNKVCASDNKHHARTAQHSCTAHTCGRPQSTPSPCVSWPRPMWQECNYAQTAAWPVLRGSTNSQTLADGSFSRFLTLLKVCAPLPFSWSWGDKTLAGPRVGKVGPGRPNRERPQC